MTLPRILKGQDPGEQRSGFISKEVDLRVYARVVVRISPGRGFRAIKIYFKLIKNFLEFSFKLHIIDSLKFTYQLSSLTS